MYRGEPMASTSSSQRTRRSSRQTDMRASRASTSARGTRSRMLLDAMRQDVEIADGAQQSSQPGQILAQP